MYNDTMVIRRFSINYDTMKKNEIVIGIYPGPSTCLLQIALTTNVF